MRVGVTEGATLVEKEIVPCPARESAETVLRQLEALIGRHLRPEVTGIGVGVPSVVDAERGIVYNVANIPAWKEVHLKRELEERFGLPVCINNDSNCFALGEQRFGEGAAFRNMVGMTLGTGVGAGIVIDGKLYGGRNTGAGEVGSLPYLDSNFEAYCSSGFFVRCHGITGKEAAGRAMQGDPQARQIWEEFGRHLGQLMQALLFAYDPEAVVLGGGISAAYGLYERTMWEELQTFPYAESVKNLQIKVSQNADIALLGAAALTE